MEFDEIKNETQNTFEMEILSKSGKLKGHGTIFIGKTFLTVKYLNKSEKHSDFKIKLKNIIVTKESDTKIKETILIDLYYIKHEAGRTLSMETIKLRTNTMEAASFSIILGDILTSFSRPKRLVVFINPISGRKKGLKIYREHMAPICKLCGIECDIIVTNRRGQALEIIDNYDLASVDGIVTVGGDGIFSECVNGLLRRFQYERSINIHNPNSKLVPVDLPIGMIPAGSGNVLIEFLHGNKDIDTAVLRIILGEVTRTNVAAVHQDGVLSVFACLILGFGLCGRMVRDCEKTRWMGPSRYSIAPLKALLTRKKYDVEVSVINRDHEKLFNNDKPRILTRTRSYDSNRKSSLAAFNQHVTAGRSNSLDNNRLRVRRKISVECSPLASTHSPLARNNSALARTHSPLARTNSPLARIHSPLVRTQSPLANQDIHQEEQPKQRRNGVSNGPLNGCDNLDIQDYVKLKSKKHTKRNSVAPDSPKRKNSIKRKVSLVNNNWVTPTMRQWLAYENPSFKGIQTLSNSRESIHSYHRLNGSIRSNVYRERKTLRDRVYSIDTWIPTLKDSKGHCNPVFGDTALTAHSVLSCSFSDHLNHLLKVNSRLAYCFRYDFVHSLRGKGYRVKIFPEKRSSHRDKYYLNYDGDALLLKSLEFEVRLHRNIVKLFGTIEDESQHGHKK